MEGTILFKVVLMYTRTLHIVCSINKYTFEKNYGMSSHQTPLIPKLSLACSPLFLFDLISIKY